MWFDCLHGSIPRVKQGTFKKEKSQWSITGFLYKSNEPKNADGNFTRFGDISNDESNATPNVHKHVCLLFNSE